VSDIPLSPAAFRQVQLHRNLARYAFLVNVAQLVAKSFIPDERTGVRKFHPFTANEQEMGRLFEAFVRNFLRREQGSFVVDAPKVPWDLDPGDSSDPSWLPEMRTDVMLTNESGRVVIETKYYTTPYQSQYGGKKLISGHLYQLLTYLSHWESTEGQDLWAYCSTPGLASASASSTAWVDMLSSSAASISTVTGATSMVR
jgi:5-methylcytosine-specific restriction enzyme subunit McrC